jgi:hypothetical protein
VSRDMSAFSEEAFKLALEYPCPRCGAVPGVQCRTEHYQKAVKPPHLDRVRLGLPRETNGGE